MRYNRRNWSLSLSGTILNRNYPNRQSKCYYSTTQHSGVPATGRRGSFVIPIGIRSGLRARKGTASPADSDTERHGPGRRARPAGAPPREVRLARRVGGARLAQRRRLPRPAPCRFGPRRPRCSRNSAGKRPVQPGRAGPGRALPPPWAAPLAGRPAERARRTPCSRPGPGRGWRGRRVRVRWPAAAATARRAKRPRRRAGGRHGATPGPCESARHRSRATRPPSGPGGRAGSGRAAPAAAVGGVGRIARVLHGAGRNSVQLRIGPHHPNFTAERRAPKPSRRTKPRRPPTPLARPAPGVRRHRPEAPGTRGGPSCRRAGLLGENRGRFWPIGRDYHENLVHIRYNNS